MKKTFAFLVHNFSESLFFTVSYFSSFPENEIILHVDKKAEISHFNSLVRENVKIISHRLDVKWGGVSMVQATLHLLHAANKESFFFLLSGDDFPIMSNDRINLTLDECGGANLIHFQDERNNYINPYERFNLKHPSFSFNKKRNLFQKAILKAMKLANFPKNRKGIEFIEREGINLIKGSQWFSFNPHTMGEVLLYLESKPEYIEAFENSFCPDEMFFQSLVHHLQCERFHDITKMNDCLRYLDWDTGPDYPRALDLTDLHKVKSSGCMFARKASLSLKYNDFEKIILHS